MMRGVLPSMTATAELVVPKSIPMTEPLTFSPESSAYRLRKVEPKGDWMAGVRRTAEVAREKALGRGQYALIRARGRKTTYGS